MTIQMARDEPGCCHYMSYSFRPTARYLLYAPSHRSARLSRFWIYATNWAQRCRRIAFLHRKGTCRLSEPWFTRSDGVDVGQNGGRRGSLWFWSSSEVDMFHDPVEQPIASCFVYPGVRPAITDSNRNRNCKSA